MNESFSVGQKRFLFNKMGKNYEEFREHGKEMVDYICNYVKSLDKRSVALNVEPGFLVEKLAGLKPTNSQMSFSSVLFCSQSKCQ